MRGVVTAAAAGALAALVLATAGCDAISSLTPFGINWRKPESPGQNPSGLWSGTTPTGGDVTFQVGNDEVLKLTLIHSASGCLLTLEAPDPAPIDAGGAFALDVADEKRRFLAQGQFTSSTTCTGSYAFELYSVVGGSCPSKGSGTFTATKTP